MSPSSSLLLTTHQTRRMLVAAALLGLVVSVGCDRSGTLAEDQVETSPELGKAYTAPAAPESEAAKPLPFPSNDWTCDLASAERAQAWIDATRPVAADQRLASVSALAPSETTPRVLLGISDTSLNLMQRDFGDDFEAAALAIEDARTRAAGSSANFAVALRIDGPTSHKRMNGLLSALASELGDEVLFVIPTAPPTARAAAPSAAALARAEQSEVESCASVDALLDRPETLAPAERSAAARENLVDAWQQCNCEADLEALLATTIWPMSQRQPVSIGQISLVRLQKMTADEGDGWTEFEGALRSL